MVVSLWECFSPNSDYLVIIIVFIFSILSEPWYFSVLLKFVGMTLFITFSYQSFFPFEVYFIYDCV